MKAYSMDLRQRVWHAMARRQQTGERIEDIAQRFEVSAQWIYKLQRRFRQENTLEPKPHSGGQPRQVTDELEERLCNKLLEQPDATLAELRDHLGLRGSIMAVFRALQRLGISRKRTTVRAKEREDPEVQAHRHAWLQRQAEFDPQHLFFLDESNVNTRLHRSYGRGPIGARVEDSIPYRHYNSTTLLSVMGRQGPVASLVYPGGTDVCALQTFIEGLLSKVLGPGDVLVLDNFPSHRSGTVQRLLAALGITVEPLPSYSPDFNPIENMFSKVKAYLKKVIPRAVAPLWQLVGEALATITTSDASGYFRHCGYQAA
jgi:transposase